MKTEDTKKKPVIDKQRNAFQLTINNPLKYGYDHNAIKKKLLENFSTIRYFCLADEIGEQGTPHTHIYACFNSRVRFSKIKRYFPEAHIEIAFGNAASNVEYIQKSGKWADSAKAETSVAGSFESWGEIPVQKGMRPDMAALYEMIKAGYSNSEILAMNNDYILNIDKLDKVRTTLLIERYKDTRRLDLRVVYISGRTGAGKTRSVLDEHGDSNVYRVSDYKNPFDGYSCEPVLVFDEFRSSLKLSDMLNYCDIYPIQLPARYANKYACYEMVYIISNWPLEQQYRDVQQDSPESWRAFLRRIHGVRVYNEDGSITVYDSVEKYLKRKEEFHVPNKEDECPFAEQQELNLDTEDKGVNLTEN